MGSKENINGAEMADLINSESKTPLKTPTKETEVKFTAIDTAINGDAKIEMDDSKSAFAGLTKEELLEYVNDPFWVRLRFVLFSLFWLIWLLMFAIAIGVIVLAPRCVGPKPKTWYQVGPLYEVDVPKLSKSSEKPLDNISNNMNYFKSLHIKALILSNILQTDLNRAVTNFNNINDNLGSLNNLKEITSKAKAKGMSTILNLTPGFTSNHHIWFNKSVTKEKPYDSYYVWAPASGIDSVGSKIPPNNWRSVNGGSAWTWNELRQEFYLHQFSKDQPELNFRNNETKQEILKIFNQWIDAGINGFMLDKVQYLLEDIGLENETISRTATEATLDDYEFYNHIQTYNHPDTANLLIEWRNYLHEKGALLFTTGATPVPRDLNETTIVTDLTLNQKFLRGLPKEHIKADELAQNVKKFRNNVPGLQLDGWPGVQPVSSSKSRIAQRFTPSFVDPVNIITLLLPGTPVIYFGEELGSVEDPSLPLPWDNSSSVGTEAINHLELFKVVAELRDDQSILHGSLNITVLNDTFIMVRSKQGSPGFALVYNLGKTNETINLADIAPVSSADAELSTIAGIRDGVYVKSETKLREIASEVHIAPDSLKLFTFVPASDSTDA